MSLHGDRVCPGRRPCGENEMRPSCAIPASPKPESDATIPLRAKDLG
jgi:hypothetical protein